MITYRQREKGKRYSIKDKSDRRTEKQTRRKEEGWNNKQSNLLWSAGEDAWIVEQGVEGQLDVEVALDDRLFHFKTN